MNSTHEESPFTGDRAIIFANGPIPPEPFIRRFLQENDLLICADGGSNRIVEYNISPDYIVGDLDSTTLETLSILDDVKVVRIPDQETTDLFKALHFVERRGVKNVLVFGAIGARPDHFLGNLSLLKLFKNRLDIQLVDEWCTIFVINGAAIIKGVPGQIVSLWPLTEEASGIWAAGLKYELEGETLYQNTRGISNELAEETATVRVKSGTLLAIIHHPDTTDFTSFSPMIFPESPGVDLP